MRNLFILARLAVMWNEFIRLSKHFFTMQSIRMNWNMASTAQYVGRSYYIPRDSNDRLMRGPDGEHLEIKRDFYDHILDFFGDYIRTYYRNVFVHSTCTHPHEKVWVEYEGDREYGYYKQYHCSKCGGYTAPKEVDRYLPEDQRHPELIDFGTPPRGYQEMMEDELDRNVTNVMNEEPNPYDDLDDGYDGYISESDWERNRRELSDSHEPNGDTHFHMTLDQYMAKFTELGFEQVLKDDFTHSHCGRERSDSFYVYAHRDGWLITFDTYTSDYGFHEGVDQGFGKTSLNSGDLRYNVEFTHGRGHGGSLLSSGGYVSYPKIDNEDTRYIYAGYHDIREGLRHNMESLKTAGTILSPWYQNHLFWLASTMSVREQDRSVVGVEAHQAEGLRWNTEINERSRQNFAALPQWVQEMIGPMKR